MLPKEYNCALSIGIPIALIVVLLIVLYLSHKTEHWSSCGSGGPVRSMTQINQQFRNRQRQYWRYIYDWCRPGPFPYYNSVNYGPDSGKANTLAYLKLNRGPITFDAKRGDNPYDYTYETPFKCSTPLQDNAGNEVPINKYDLSDNMRVLGPDEL